MKKILLSLFFGLFCITNSYAVDLTVSSFDEPIFWQPTAIVNALKAFNATEEQFATFTDLFYETTNNKTFGTQRISAETISKIWFVSFLTDEELAPISEENYERASDFIMRLVAEQNAFVESQRNKINSIAETDSSILTTAKAEKIYKNFMEMYCEPSRISQFSVYERYGRAYPNTKETSVVCYPIKTKENNRFSCTLERVFATSNPYDENSKDIVCSMACNEVSFTKISSSSYEMEKIDCSAQTIMKY